MHNIGAILRSADAFGVERVYLTGYTATPPRKEIAKTALGAEDRVLWEYHIDPLPLMAQLKQQGWTILALENGREAMPLSDALRHVHPERTVLLLGNEVEGVVPDVLAICDQIVEIILPGRKRSLNVSVAAGIALFVVAAENGYHVGNVERPPGQRAPARPTFRSDG